MKDIKTRAAHMMCRSREKQSKNNMQDFLAQVYVDGDISTALAYSWNELSPSCIL